MNEIVYSADSELRHPSRFLRNALHDLRAGAMVAPQWFVRNLQVRYRRTWLGYLWLLLPPLGTTVVWVYVQSRQIVTIPATAVPYPLYVLTGTILWQVFVDALNMPLQQLVASRQMITRSRLPHEALILSGLLETMFNCAVRMVAIVPLLFAYGVQPRLTALLLPFGILSLAALGLALGLVAAPLGMLFEDVGRTILLVTGFWFFLTPVIYPAHGSGVMRFNPVTPLLDRTRSWLLGGSAADGFLLVVAITIPAIVIAWLVLRLARPHVIARLG